MIAHLPVDVGHFEAEATTPSYEDPFGRRNLTFPFGDQGGRAVKLIHFADKFGNQLS